jgi:hypothetical protein
MPTGEPKTRSSTVVTVRWQQWIETWRHVSAGGFGVYVDQSRTFASAEEARGFAAGQRLNPLCCDVRSDV